MFRRLSARIGLAFAAVAFATLVATGATMFVILRGLHADATISALTQTSQPLVFQLRTAAAQGDLRATLADLRAQVADDGLGVHLVTAAGAVVDLGGTGGPVETIGLDPTAPRGTVTSGSVRFSDGRDHLYSATTLRGPNGVGARAIVLSQLDTSAGDALRDLVRVLPVVVILVGLIGVPIAYALSRSVTGPLRRLAAATADLRTTEPAPLPLEGPAEVRELTDRFNAMAAELAETRDRETRLLAGLRHDLRTPLTVIGGFASALADGTASGDDAPRAAAAIAEEAARLERLLDELGALERLRDGAAGLRPEWLDARRIVARDRRPVRARRRGRRRRADRGRRLRTADGEGFGLAADRQARGADPGQSRRQRAGGRTVAGRARLDLEPGHPGAPRRRSDRASRSRSPTTGPGSPRATPSGRSSGSTGAIRAGPGRGAAWAWPSSASWPAPTAGTRLPRTSPRGAPG